MGAILRDARRAAGLSQARAAATIARSQQVLSNWENGKGRPDYGSLRALERAYRLHDGTLYTALADCAPEPPPPPPDPLATIVDRLDALDARVAQVIARIESIAPDAPKRRPVGRRHPPADRDGVR